MDITAGLMGLTPDEARPFVVEAPPLNLPRSAAPQRGYAGAAGGGGARQARWLLSMHISAQTACDFGLICPPVSEQSATDFGDFATRFGPSRLSCGLRAAVSDL